MFADLRKATSLVLKTKSYLLYRASVYGIIGAVWLVIILVCWGVAKAFGGSAGVITFLIAAGGLGLVWPLVREYVLYLLRAGHVALVTELLTEGELPEGASQTAWAKERVMHYFKEISVLALVDQLVKGIINALNRTVFNVMSILPTRAMAGLAKFIQAVIRLSLTYVDEAILAYTFKTGNENVYDSAKSGILIYAQSWKPVLKTAVMLTVFGYLFTIVAALVFMIPLAPVAYGLRKMTEVPQVREQIGVAIFAVALLLGSLLKWIFFDPIACTATISVFLREAETTKPDPEWEARIEKVSDKFAELKNKALERMSAPRVAEPGKATPAETALEETAPAAPAPEAP